MTKEIKTNEDVGKRATKEKEALEEKLGRHPTKKEVRKKLPVLRRWPTPK